MVAQSVACLLRMQSAPTSILASGTFFGGNYLPLPLIQEEQVVSYLQNNGLFNTGKLPPGGLPRNSVVK